MKYPVTKINHGIPVLLILLLSLFMIQCKAPLEITTAEEEVPDTPREMRAVWIATVGNIDWPTEPGLSTTEQKTELRAMMDRAELLNMNTIIFQVRTATDALYDSDYEPWSEYLTGEQGKAPDPAYDPLEFAIEEAHKRGLELHAWVNPFRARYHTTVSELSEDHLKNTHPEMVVEYGNHLWMDPGHPEAPEWSMEVLRDIVERYNIDALHIDDYFYPYQEWDENDELIEFPDSATYAAYVDQHGEIDRNDWRRQNVDTFIERLHHEIKKIDPQVRFGVSPIGMWRPDHPEGIEGFDAYDRIYADARKWFREGWMDYFVPQLYWPIGEGGNRFTRMLNWWEEQNLQDIHYWPGHIPNRIGYGEETWPASEIVDQIELTRSLDGADGNFHFSMRVLMMDPKDLVNTMLEAYNKSALIPATDWLGDSVPSTPDVDFSIYDDEPHLTYRPGDDEENLRWWVIKTRYGDEWSYHIQPDWKQQISLTRETEKGALNAVAVTAVNRIGKESAPAVVDWKQ